MFSLSRDGNACKWSRCGILLTGLTLTLLAGLAVEVLLGDLGMEVLLAGLTLEVLLGTAVILTDLSVEVFLL